MPNIDSTSEHRAQARRRGWFGIYHETERSETIKESHQEHMSV